MVDFPASMQSERMQDAPADRTVAFRSAEHGDRTAVLELLRACELPVEDLAEPLPEFLVAVAHGQVVAAVALERLDE
jgi:N-acetylglutamate synthase-like GNAT family acetyltransferase